MSKEEKSLIALLNEKNPFPEIEIKRGKAVDKHGITPFIRQDVQVTMTIEQFCSVLEKFNPDIYDRFLYIDIPDEVDTTNFKTPSGDFNFILNSQFLIIKDGYLATLKKLLLDGPTTFGISVIGIGDIPDFLKDTELKFNQKIPDYSSKQDEISYPVYKEETFSIVDVEDPYKTMMYVVNKNIPYDFYSKLPIIPESFSYNISEKKPRLFGLPLDIFCNKWDNSDDKKKAILMNGHLRNYIDISGNNITMSGVASEFAVIGMYYGFPTIPASIVLTDSTLNIMGRESYPNDITIEELNKVCSPYIIMNPKGES